MNIPIFRRSDRRRGQAMVEMVLILPVFLMIIIGTLEFGFAFDHNLTLQYATREGARSGSALVNGGGPLGCGAGKSPNAATVDQTIVSAVERVLGSPSSPIDINMVSEIRIFKANAAGGEAGPANRWVYAAGAGPVVDGRAMNFAPSGAQTWSACSRANGSSPDSIGVSVSYTYTLRTPIRAFFSWVSLPAADRTVMQMNPTNQ